MHFKLVFQALQVYYMKGIKEPSWSAIVDTKPRELYEMSFPEEPYQEEEIKCDDTHVNLENDEDDMQLTRNVVDCMDLD